MRGIIRIVAVSGILLFAVVIALARTGPADDHGAFVIVFKDGHRQSLATAEVDHIDIKAPATIIYKNGRREKITREIDRVEFADAAHALIAPGRAHYIGNGKLTTVQESDSSSPSNPMEMLGRVLVCRMEHGAW